MRKMILELDFQSETPIYLQIKYEVMKGIARGKLHSGESLPSVRMLAADLGINMHTVNKAYQLLKLEGFILIHRQKGVVVNPAGMPSADEEFIKQLQSNLQPFVIEALCRGMNKQRFLELAGQIFGALEKEGE